jgi:hypothetical protein
MPKAGGETVTTNQFFAILGSFVAVNSILIGILIKYLDAKIDPIKAQVDTLVQYMVLHEGKIERLDERTKGKA